MPNSLFGGFLGDATSKSTKSNVFNNANNDPTIDATLALQPYHSIAGAVKSALAAAYTGGLVHTKSQSNIQTPEAGNISKEEVGDINDEKGTTQDAPMKEDSNDEKGTGWTSEGAAKDIAKSHFGDEFKSDVGSALSLRDGGIRKQAINSLLSYI